ncbi:hypothetical protein AB9F26_20605 [Falsihalocynthiibacter sp. BN13B15]|uniref:hypothetical protein n=1 Tax=Falsihalocynthiibacter sp. BN13B15 TaxID=3240871 RepID=UPI00350EFDF5
MALIMSHADWIKNTYSLTSPRSAALKAIDQALMVRNESQAKFALVSWINAQNSKKQNWHKSVRNSKGAVADLYKQLNVLGSEVSFDSLGDEWEDFFAKNEIRKLQNAAKAKMFDGKKLELKHSVFGVARAKKDDFWSKTEAVAKSSAGVSYKAAKATKKFGSLASKIEDTIELITTGISDGPKKEIIGAVFGSSAQEFAISAAPLFGLVTSGGKAVLGWNDVIKTIDSAEKMMKIRPSIRMGDPSEALTAISQILDRQISYKARKAGIHSGAFAAKGLGLLIDGGAATNTVAGACETVAVLLNQLADFVADVREMEAANELIAAKEFDLKLFETCPILGCYYVSIQDHSSIMDFNFENMGKQNWQQEALRLKYAIDPVIKKSQQLIEKSRIEIPGMASAKGVYQSSRMQRFNVWTMSKGLGRAW